MIIKNGLVFNEKGEFEYRDIYTQGGLITEHPVLNDEEIDATGLYVVPGFVDIHTHGCIGHDFYSKEIATHLKSKGITSFCPTSMTYDEATLNKMFDSIGEATLEEMTNLACKSECARVLGINMEGPFISKEKAGAQNIAYISEPDIDAFRRLNKNSRIKLVTIAPELEGADEFINELKNEVNISIGHSMADYDTASKAFGCGANHVTHMFNAMNGLHHRDSGIPGAASDNEKVYVELICDGIHLSPSMIRAALKIYGEDRVVAISDSMEACDMPDGEYSLGGQKVIKNGNAATLTDGTLAGSVTNLYDAFLTLVKNGISLGTALKLVTINPAKSIGMDKKVGTLSVGAFADILLMDKDLQLKRIL